MGEEIAKQANAEIEKRREAGEAGLISELKKVEMEKVYYAVDSSGSVTEGGEKIVTSGKHERKIKVKVTNGSSLMPQLYPHTNVRLKNDNSNRTDDTLTVRFFFVPERLQNTIGGTNKDERKKMWDEWNSKNSEKEGEEEVIAVDSDSDEENLLVMGAMREMMVSQAGDGENESGKDKSLSNSEPPKKNNHPEYYRDLAVALTLSREQPPSTEKPKKRVRYEDDSDSE